MLYELNCIYDGRKSFYHKAMCSVSPENIITLYSYETPVAQIDTDGNFYLNIKHFAMSQTTIRHIKEFYKQNTGKTEITKADIERMERKYLW